MSTFAATIPFVRHCGIEAVDFDGTRTLLRLELEPQHLNNLGIAHGGLVCTLIDTAMGTAGRMVTGQTMMTIDMNTTFLSPGRGTLLAEGRVVRVGRSIVFCEAEIRTETGEIVARGTGTMRVVKRKADAPVADASADG